MIAPVRVTEAPAYIGTASLVGETWELEVPPHVEMVLRRLFKRAARQAPGKLKLTHSAEICYELQWVATRWPLRFIPLDAVERGAQKYEERIATVRDILGPDYEPPPLEMALPLRSYQARHAALCYELGRVFNADDLGLGKTASGIGVIARPECRPAVVVVPTHLALQWKRELGKFLPEAQVHIARKMTPYPLSTIFGAPDVLIITYHKLHGWASTLKRWAKTVIFDECHALRRNGSDRYAAAEVLAQACRWRMGLSATPTFNMGGEFYNIAQVLAPGLLGTRAEFASAWLQGGTDQGVEKSPIKDARAFGSYLRSIGFLVRHTRAEVKRELPPVTHITQTVSSDPAALEAIKGNAAALAKLILSESPADHAEAFTAGGQLDMMVRQATGIAKAPYVAEFVRMLCESGEQILLAGWHRTVYDIWTAALGSAGIKVAMYTGSETPTQKELARKRFIAKEAQVLILSLRSGEGLDGLQEACSVVVKGELDWAYSVHEQLIGRVNRDGQKSPVLVYWLTTDSGSDPLIAALLGVKEGQMKDIRDPNRPAIEERQTDPDRVRKLAELYLSKQERPPAIEEDE